MFGARERWDHCEEAARAAISAKLTVLVRSRLEKELWTTALATASQSKPASTVGVVVCARLAATTFAPKVSPP